MRPLVGQLFVGFHEPAATNSRLWRRSCELDGSGGPSRDDSHYRDVGLGLADVHVLASCPARIHLGARQPTSARRPLVWCFRRSLRPDVPCGGGSAPASRSPAAARRCRTVAPLAARWRTRSGPPTGGIARVVRHCRQSTKHCASASRHASAVGAVTADRHRREGVALIRQPRDHAHH